MRKTVFLCVAIFSGLSLSASPVSKEKALKIASRVLESGPQTKSSSGELKIIWDGETTHTKSSGAPAFYVVGRDHGGFVIVAGDDRVRPVLGLSYENEFQVEGMPCNVSAWMENMKAYCREPRVATARVREQWAALAETKSVVLDQSYISGEYMKSRTVQWGQREPANLYCPIPPEYDNIPCGCVPLAFSEILTWFGYPERGKGFVETYTYQTDSGTDFTVEGHELGVPYDWATLQSIDIPEQFRANKETEAGRQIARLVYDVATIIKTYFNAEGSTGHILWLADKFSYHMGYSKGFTSYHRSDFASFEWNPMLKEEITRYPVYYRGSDKYSSVGHGYVFDGYAYFQQTDLVFHVNFGWTGNCNGYYYSDVQETSPSKVAYANCAALIGFFPDPEGTSTCPPRMNFVNPESGGGLSFAYYSESRRLARVVANGVKNTGELPIYGQYGIFFSHFNDQIDDEPLEESNLASEETPLKSGYYQNNKRFYFDLPQEINFGDRLILCYKTDESEYRQIRYSRAGDGIEELPLFPVAFIQTEAHYKAGDTFYFRLVNHNYAYPEARWFVTGPSGETACYEQSDIACKLASAGKYTIKVVTAKETIVTTVHVE